MQDAWVHLNSVLTGHHKCCTHMGQQGTVADVHIVYISFAHTRNPLSIRLDSQYKDKIIKKLKIAKAEHEGEPSVTIKVTYS